MLSIQPQFFDEYVALTVGDRLMADRDLLNIMRALLFEANETTRVRFLQRGRNVLGAALSVGYVRDFERNRGR